MRCTGTFQPIRFYHLYEYKLTHTPIRAAIEFLRIVKMVEPYYESMTVPVCIVQGQKRWHCTIYILHEYLYERLGSMKKS